MAKRKKNLSLSWQDTHCPSPACKLLFVSFCHHNTQPSTQFHSHDFWQLELITAGAIICEFQNSSHRLSKDMAVLIPPGCSHTFNYTRKDVQWLSFKFHISGLDNCGHAIINKNDSRTNSLLIALADIYKDITLPDVSARIITESLLTGIITSVYPKHFKADSSELLAEIENYITRNIDQPITIEDIAAEVNYSSNHLGVKFRQQMDMSLKTFIDFKRADHAKHLLLFTNRSIGEIAIEMGFDNIYAFSRFFKRVTTISPSAVRKTKKSS